VFLSWSFAVFIRWLIRVSRLIVCRIHPLADPCFFADRLPYSSVGWSVFLCWSFAVFIRWLIRVSRLIVCHILRFHWLIVCRSWSFAVYFCRWSFVVPDRLPFTFAADRLSFLIVFRLLLPLIVCRSWSFAVYFCRWSFVVPDLLPFTFAADRLSFLIVCHLLLSLVVCRFLSLLIVCSSFLLLIIGSPIRQIICHILLLWLICIFVTDRSPYFLLTDTSFLADRCRPSVANCFGTSS